MRRGKPWAWIIFGLGVVYFMIPLIATFIFSLRMRRDGLSFDAYLSVFGDARFQSTLTYSVVVGILAIIVGVAIVIPAAYVVRLRLPWLRQTLEFITLLPLIIPPIVLVFGYLRMYNTSSLIPLTSSAFGTDILLTCAYVVLALPYMYRSVDTGLRSIDAHVLSEAATSLGAGPVRIIYEIIVPNIFVAVISGAFLTFAIVIGEFTMASLLSRPAFGPYLQLTGTNKAYEPSALAVISFIITWGAMGMIQLLTRFAPRTAARTD
ncbi:MAG TPA: ABC transporter permease [Devosia sp.]|nr:ABC transporter permease [Devosia sp.]